MTDIVERLRNPMMVAWYVLPDGSVKPILDETHTRADMAEAAETIEYLRRDIEELKRGIALAKDVTEA